MFLTAKSPLSNDPKLFWKSFEGKDDSTLPITPQEAIHNCTKLYTSCQSINDRIVPTIQLLDVFIEGGIWAHMEDLANHKAKEICGLKRELQKRVANDLYEPISKLFNLVAKEGFLASWTNIIQHHVRVPRGITGP
jgi:hypothetical protein